MLIDDILDEDRYINRNYLIQNNIDSTLYNELIIKHNKEFIARKYKEYEKYFDDMFLEVDPNIKLDLEQRIAILTDEDYNLIIAGAGAGKTTTMLAKIKYLVEKQKVDPKDIIAISFGRKNVEELDNKLNQQFSLNIKTATFHKFGKEIINSIYGNRFDIARENTLYLSILQYLKSDIYKHPARLQQMLDFLIQYFDFDPDIKRFNSIEEYHKYKIDSVYETIKGKLGEYNKQVISKRSRIKRTIKSEYLRSKFEVNVANYLFLNGLEYEYEKKYSKVTAKGVSYHPDFTVTQGENIVYIEVLSINQNGESRVYNDASLEIYNFNIDMKKRQLAEDRANLILVFSSYNDHRSPFEHLKEDLQAYGFALNKKSNDEIYQALMNTNINSYFHRFALLVADFIQKCKIEEISIDRLYELMNSSIDERTKKFIYNIIPIYENYMNYLKDHNLIDFDDMILLAKNLLADDDVKLDFHYKYIIIDEYQDISNQRFSLIKNFAHLFSSKIIAVGDDWQSIFGFAGSNVELFTRFQEEMGYGEILKIQTTYRNAQELIDLAGDFVQKDDFQIKKTLKSSKHIQKPVIIYSYDDKSGNEKTINKASAICSAIKDIIDKDPKANITLLGRYGFDKENLINTNFFDEKPQDKIICTKYPSANIHYYTVHKSKGLECDYVIIINAINSTYGFPSKISDDPVFDVIHNHNSHNLTYAEERRLFYVALTRTKNNVSIIVPRSQPSPFILEIKNDIHVDFKDNVAELYLENLASKKCPKCGAYLIYGYSNEIGDYVYYCPTEKELCGFRTYSLENKINLVKCPKCDDGYLCYKSTAVNGNYVFACNNYEQGEENCCNFITFINPHNIEKGCINRLEKEKWKLEEFSIQKDSQKIV